MDITVGTKVRIGNGRAVWTVDSIFPGHVVVRRPKPQSMYPQGRSYRGIFLPYLTEYVYDVSDLHVVPQSTPSTQPSERGTP
jgi:hypothetical protein